MPKHGKKYLYPHPDKPGVLITRARVWQLKQAARGRCPKCGHKNKRKRGLCDTCEPRKYKKVA